MKIYSLLGTDYINGKQFIMGSVVLILDNGVKVVSSDFNKSRNEKILVTVWDSERKVWGTALMRNKYSFMMWEYHRKVNATKKPYQGFNWEKAMEHDRKHKHGTGGVRLCKWSGNVTDYECAKNPLHDFRRVWS